MVSAPLELTLSQGGPLQRDRARDPRSKPDESAEEREQDAGAELAVQPLAPEQP